jgi:hypothetical protein
MSNAEAAKSLEKIRREYVHKIKSDLATFQRLLNKENTMFLHQT